MIDDRCRARSHKEGRPLGRPGPVVYVVPAACPHGLEGSGQVVGSGGEDLSIGSDLVQKTALNVIDEPADVIFVRQERRGLKSFDRCGHARTHVGDGAELEG